MPRVAFLADLERLKQSCPFNGVTAVRRGDDDMVYFSVLTPIAPEVFEVIEIAATIFPDISLYPTAHSYHMFLVDDNAPNSVAARLQDLSPMSGFNLQDAIAHAAEFISSEPTDSQDDHDTGDESFDDFMDNYDDTDDEELDLDDQNKMHVWIRAGDINASTTNLQEGISSVQNSSPEQRAQNIRTDLALVKCAGFKVAYYGNIFHCPINFHMCISVRMSKLGVSAEAMETWSIEQDDYLILALCFTNGYKSLPSILSGSANSVKYKIGLSKTYRPSYTILTSIFTDTSEKTSFQTEWRSTFISRPLEELMNSKFIPILKNRSDGSHWTHSEKLHHALVFGQKLPERTDEDPNPTEDRYPSIVTNDHYADTSGPTTQKSFPLIAMQFFLRHFVQCTEFCLVCHRRLDNIVEAIKPYVCDEPLCLYQYMSLGFGTGVEHEIMTQPLVVDMLISFAASAAKHCRLKTLPIGLGLMVPALQLLGFHIQLSPLRSYNARPVNTHLVVNNDPNTPNSGGLATPPALPPPTDIFGGKFALIDWNTNEIQFEKGKPKNLDVGNWLVIIPEFEQLDELKARHAKVVKTFPNRITVTSSVSPMDLVPRTGQERVRLVKYDQNFDDLPNHDAHATLLLLINTLPSVSEMGEYLRQNPTRTLADWNERLSPTSLGILRWIIASNRACIREVTDEAICQDLLVGQKAFRLTMGAPDKEHRFTNEVIATTKRLNLRYPTIMAFHGSPMCNWHGIIREGLNFDETLHGRAYGNGVYHSQHFSTSNGYTGAHVSGNDVWYRCGLKIRGAIAMNELVNAPAEYVNTSYHLVVDKVDWIQTRYLFVAHTPTYDPEEAIDLQPQSTNNARRQSVEVTPEDGFVQDPAMPLNGPWNTTPKVLPVKAGAYTRLLKNPADFKKRKASVLESPGGFDDAASVLTVEEDDEVFSSDPIWSEFAQDKHTRLRLDVLHHVLDKIRIREQEALENAAREREAQAKQALEDEARNKEANQQEARNAILKASSTNFVPGILDHGTLPRLPPPLNASSGASKAIAAALKSLDQAQKNESILENGWFVDVEQIDNIFQWIVEFHSFPQEIPLTKQMVDAGIPSIIVELRFPNQYPFAPPFARVIRPRMLPFHQNGGGHVTLGGSICMELLTGSGWSPALSLMNVLLNIRLALCDTEPRPAQLDPRYMRTSTKREEDEVDRFDYGFTEAVDAYVRACRMHGWTVPEGFDRLALGAE